MDTSPEAQRRRDSEATMVNPTNPDVEKRNKSVKKDQEGETYIDEKASVGESTIKVKQLSWQQAAGCLSAEYVVIAILSFPSSYSVLGMAGGVIATLLVGLIVWYTGLVLWRYCMAHPGSTDIVDLSARLFPVKYRKVVTIVVSGMFLLNNLFIMGLHVLSGTIALNTLHADPAFCTLAFAGIMTLIMLSLSFFRELNQVAVLGIVAATTMGIAFLLCLIFLGIQAHPAGWVAGSPITIRAWAAPGTTFVQGFNALLNIVYTFVGQILYPSYIDDMHTPSDFPKALAVVSIFEIVVFTIAGSIGYFLIGDEYMVSPAYGALVNPYLKVVAAFTLPTLIVVGVLYSHVTSRFVFARIFPIDSIHRVQHTVKGWAVWVAIVITGFVIAFIIGVAIPFFDELLSLLSSLFDWYFGFALEGLAFFALYKRGARFNTPLRGIETIVNVIVLVMAIFILCGGAYSSISQIKDDYANGTAGKAFTCDFNGFTGA